MSIAIQMDPPQRLLAEVDSTLMLAREAARRGHKVEWYEPATLSLGPQGVTAVLHLMIFDAGGVWLNPTVPSRQGALDEKSAVLVRQDPPFDMAYITATYLLEHLQPNVLVVNNAGALRNAPEKLLPMAFPQLMPPTLITSDKAMIRAFRTENGAIILKPLYRAGGAGVVYLTEIDPNLDVAIELLCADGLPIMAQKFIPEVLEGDKRIVLLDGKIAGALLRRPVSGSIRANLHAGGSLFQCDVTQRDREICDTIAPVLANAGLLLAGIDVIGPWLTEINTTSPGLLLEFRELTGIDIAAAFWDAVEAKLAVSA